VMQFERLGHLTLRQLVNPQQGIMQQVQADVLHLVEKKALHALRQRYALAPPVLTSEPWLLLHHRDITDWRIPSFSVQLQSRRVH
jgi:hypothetical protein